ncbi:hypothetical protein N5K27_22620 [Pigmentiphaga sp. GD03639]|uniref:hypothetical protein n=1 Tax=Pigmentiphaga sp. GD03639 TaxID=2975354 RepID=UPI002448DF94|nr:hypothetical protein [Pigmentiphaga sp. GD03639]MDH2239107.1 hypothetical protein [Pigmentiphaga sp. GD03639]
MYDSNQAQMQAIGQAIVPPPRPNVTIMGLLPELGQELEALDSAIDRLRSAVSPALRSVPPVPCTVGGMQEVSGEPPIVEGLQEFIRRARDLRRQVDDIGQRLAL